MYFETRTEIREISQCIDPGIFREFELNKKSNIFIANNLLNSHCYKFFLNTTKETLSKLRNYLA